MQFHPLSTTSEFAVLLRYFLPRLFILPILMILPSGAALTKAHTDEYLYIRPTIHPEHQAVLDPVGGDHGSDSPIAFIENVGQFDERVRFHVIGGPVALWLATDGLWITDIGYPQSEYSDMTTRVAGNASWESDARRTLPIKVTFVGASPTKIEPFNRLQTRVSYFIGNQPDQWQSDVPVWGGVRYRNLYPGVDLEVISGDGRWSWQFIQAEDELQITDANTTSRIGIQITGAENSAVRDREIQLISEGRNLVVPLPVSTLPLDVQMIGSTSQVQLLDEGQPGFGTILSEHNTESESSVFLSSDIGYSTFFGGSSVETGHAIAVDKEGNTYVAGTTLQTGLDPDSATGYVAKLDKTGTSFHYIAYLGGDGWDVFTGIAVDGAGNASVVGWTQSTDFPLASTKADLKGQQDALVAKLNQTGTGLLYATYLGGEHSQDYATDVALDSDGNAYVTGYTSSHDFPTTVNAYQRSFGGGIDDAFVAKVSAANGGILFSTYLGGEAPLNYGASDRGEAIAVGSGGHAFVAGLTCSSNFPTTQGAFQTASPGLCPTFVSKLNSSGGALVYSTLLGGSYNEWPFDIAVDATGSAYITGMTESRDFPVTEAAPQKTHTGDLYDAFVAKLNTDGSGLAFATYLGGEESDWGFGIAVDASGYVYVSGVTQSTTFATTCDSAQPHFSHFLDAFITKYNPSGTHIVYSSYVGWSNYDPGWGDIVARVALNSQGDAYVGSTTSATDFPVSPGAAQVIHGNDRFASVMKLKIGNKTSPGTYCIKGQVIDEAGKPSAGVSISADHGGSTTTDANGNYTLTSLTAGSYLLTASKSGFSFSPTSQVVTVPPSKAKVDFTATFADSDSKYPIVLLPGIMGSRLEAKVPQEVECNQRASGIVWLNFEYLSDPILQSESLNTLYLNESGDNAAHVCDEGRIAPFDLVDSAAPVKWFKDIYRGFIESLEGAGYTVYTFPYDWRLDIETTADALASFIQEKVGADGQVILIGHSMGGLVARAYVGEQDHASRVHKVITIGTPYLGAPKAAYVMLTGDAGLLPSYLRPVFEPSKPDVQAIVRNSIGSMQLLPSRAYHNYGPYYVSDSGVLATYESTKDYFIAKGQNSFVIDQADDFHTKYDDFRANYYLAGDYYVLATRHLPTVSAIRENRCTWHFGQCYRTSKYLLGDETVPIVSGSLRAGGEVLQGPAKVCVYSAGKVSNDHTELLADLNVRTDVLRLLRNEAPQHCATDVQGAVQAAQVIQSFREIGIWGDAEVRVEDGQGNYVGVDENGFLHKGLPDVTYQAEEGGTTVTLPLGVSYRLVIEHTGARLPQITAVDFAAPALDLAFTAQAQALFLDLPTGEGKIAVLENSGGSLLELRVGLANAPDGKPTQMLAPDTVLTDPESAQDFIMPITTLRVKGAKDKEGHYTGPITATLSSQDQGVGVLKSYYSLDGGQTWLEYQEALEIGIGQASSIQYYSIDKAGNEEYPPQVQILSFAEASSIFLPFVIQ